MIFRLYDKNSGSNKWIQSARILINRAFPIEIWLK